LAQRNWQLDHGLGRQHIVGIYHGQDSGHVVVHCNNKVLVLDFNVLQAKTYSFFIDQELYELAIQPQANSYHYELNINYEVDTPKNRSRKTTKDEDRRAFFLSLIVGGLIFLMAFVLAFFLLKK
jgi:hypothetical protein